MLLVVDRNAEQPVYGQIAGQIRDSILAGRIVAGTTLPAVRALASDLGVNLNTVARAYRQLEQEGFLRIRNRTGVEVLSPPARMRREDRDRLLGELRHLLGRMRQAGLGGERLRAALLSELDAIERGSGRDQGGR